MAIFSGTKLVCFQFEKIILPHNIYIFLLSYINERCPKSTFYVTKFLLTSTIISRRCTFSINFWIKKLNLQILHIKYDANLSKMTQQNLHILNNCKIIMQIIYFRQIKIWDMFDWSETSKWVKLIITLVINISC